MFCGGDQCECVHSFDTEMLPLLSLPHSLVIRRRTVVDFEWLVDLEFCSLSWEEDSVLTRLACWTACRVLCPSNDEVLDFAWR